MGRRLAQAAEAARVKLAEPAIASATVRIQADRHLGGLAGQLQAHRGDLRQVPLPVDGLRRLDDGLLGVDAQR